MTCTSKVETFELTMDVDLGIYMRNNGGLYKVDIHHNPPQYSTLHNRHYAQL
jgi:hypothetical protein